MSTLFENVNTIMCMDISKYYVFTDMDLKIRVYICMCAYVRFFNFDVGIHTCMCVYLHICVLHTCMRVKKIESMCVRVGVGKFHVSNS